MSDSATRSGLVLELAEEFLDRYRRGERPPLGEYVDRHPELAAEIKEVFPAMAMMESIALADDSLEAREQQSGVRDQTLTTRQLGDFRIIREVGRGGMGVVYEAEQVSLGRHVALKLLPFKALADAKHKRRFEREAKAAARLHHTNIVPVFGVGEHDGLPYYVMQFIQGLGLDAVLKELQEQQSPLTQPSSPVTRGEGRGRGTAHVSPTRPEDDREHDSAPNLSRARRPTHPAAQVAQSLMTGRLDVNGADGESPAAQEVTDDRSDESPSSLQPTADTRLDSSGTGLSSSSVVLPGQSGTQSKTKRSTYWHSVAQIGVQVAGALDYAHKQGIVHRDIKPSNLLLDLHGIVWVTDFGLAKTDDQQNLTNTGDMLGTFRYMPPEAFEGKFDVRGDVYELGLTLYELLALRPAFSERDKHKLIKQVTSGEPPRLDKLNPSIPRDLVTIVQKAIDRDPARRYPSASELSADLQRYLDDRPIQARRVGNVERLRRWTRRNPMVAALSASVAVLLMASALGSLLLSVNLWSALDQSRHDRDMALKANRNARLREAEALVGEAHGTRYSRREGQRFATLIALKRAAAIGRELEQPKDWFDRLRNEAIAALALTDMYITKRWNGWLEGTVNLAVSGDGRIYYRSDQTGNVSIRRIEDDSELARLPGEGRPVSFWPSHDGNDLAVVSPSGGDNPQSARVLHLSSAGLQERFRLASVNQISFLDQPEGRLAVSIHANGALSVHRVATGERQSLLEPVEITNPGLTVHPQEPLVAVFSYFHRAILVRNILTGAVVCREVPPWSGGSCCFWHPSGKYLCVCQIEGNVMRDYRFDAQNNRLTYWRTLPNGQPGAPKLLFNHHGDRYVAYGSWARSIAIRDFWTGQELFVPKTPVRLGSSPALGDDRLGFTMVSETQAHSALWSIGDAREYRAMIHVGSRPISPAYHTFEFAHHPEGRLVAQSFPDGVAFFDRHTGSELAFLSLDQAALCFDKSRQGRQKTGQADRAGRQAPCVGNWHNGTTAGRQAPWLVADDRTAMDGNGSRSNSQTRKEPSRQARRCGNLAVGRAMLRFPPVSATCPLDP